MGSLDTRLHSLEAAADHALECICKLEARVAALEACVDCDQVPPCPRPAPDPSKHGDAWVQSCYTAPAQAAQPAPQQPRTCSTCRRVGDPETCYDPIVGPDSRCANWQPQPIYEQPHCKYVNHERIWDCKGCSGKPTLGCSYFEPEQPRGGGG